MQGNVNPLNINARLPEAFCIKSKFHSIIIKLPDEFMFSDDWRRRNYITMRRKKAVSSPISI